MYDAATNMLRQTTDNDKEREASWGKLACEILSANWEAALDDITKLAEHIDGRLINSPLAQLQQRSWLIHWSLFPLFNDEKAREFTDRTGIAAFKWDVSDFEACKAGIAKVEAELGPVEIVVNNAGITRDGVLHRMSFEQWNDVVATNLTSCFNMCRNVIDGSWRAIAKPPRAPTPTIFPPTCASFRAPLRRVSRPSPRRR